MQGIFGEVFSSLEDPQVRIFSAINSTAFQECFFSWLKAIIDLLPEKVIAIDGKSIRASGGVLVIIFHRKNGMEFLFEHQISGQTLDHLARYLM